MKTRFWLLFGLALILAVGIFVGSALWQSRHQAPPTQPWTGLAPLVDYAEAEVRARSRAQSWSADAQLIMVEGYWRPPAEWLQTEYLPIAWSYTYYSAAQQAIASVGVSGEQLAWIPPMPVNQARPPLDPFPVPQGPNVAWLVFRAAGGEDFLRSHADATVKLILRQVDGFPRWEVTAISEAGERLQVNVDAQSGALIP